MELARKVVRELGVTAEVNEVQVKDLEHAERLRFLGSPSVRIDGIDVEPAARCSSAYGFACRTYGRAHLPPRELLVAALENGRKGQVAPGGRRKWQAILTVPGAGALRNPTKPNT